MTLLQYAQSKQKLLSTALFYYGLFMCRNNAHVALQMLFVVIWGALTNDETEKFTT